MDVNTFIRSQDSKRLRENDQENAFRAQIYGDRPSMLVRFYVDAYEDETASDEAGYPIFKEAVYVHLQSPDSRESQTHLADNEYISRFAREWELFLKNREHPKIPVSTIPQISPAVTRAFEKMGFKTIDDVIEATLPEPYQKYQKWAMWIKAAHEAAAGRKMKVSV